jgi:hypothetical protein
MPKQRGPSHALSPRSVWNLLTALFMYLTVMAGHRAVLRFPQLRTGVTPPADGSADSDADSKRNAEAHSAFPNARAGMDRSLCYAADAPAHGDQHNPGNDDSDVHACRDGCCNGDCHGLAGQLRHA